MTDRAYIKGWKRAAVTVTLAYALALQALLLALGGALHAGTAPLPQAILCEPGGQSAPDPLRPGTHDDLCCILNCHGSTPPGGPAPAVASLHRPTPARTMIGPSWEEPVRRRVSSVFPLGSRAPPRFG
jgi:hypothetical protein